MNPNEFPELRSFFNEKEQIITSLDKGTQPFVVCDG